MSYLAVILALFVISTSGRNLVLVFKSGERFLPLVEMTKRARMVVGTKFSREITKKIHR
jgi:hypothetical protein